MTSVRTAPGAAMRPEHSLVPLHGYRAVLTASGDDPFVRYELPADYTGPAAAVGVRASGSADAVAFVRAGTTRRAGLTVVGSPAAVEPLLQLLRSSGLERQFPRASVSLPRSCAPLLSRYFAVGGGGDWDWMWTTALPPVFPGEARLLGLDDEADADGIRALLARANPRSHGHPGEGVVDRWLGLRDTDGEVLACAALHRNKAGIPHLSGITVAPELRGQGWGRALTAALTRRSLESHGVCTLGIFADNDVARRLYHGLGYRTAQAWASRSIDGTGPAAIC